MSRELQWVECNPPYLASQSKMICKNWGLKLKDTNFEYASVGILVGILTELSNPNLEQKYPYDPKYDINNPSLYKRVFGEQIKPFFERLLPEQQIIVKRTFMYFLTTKNAPFEDILSGLQETPLPIPDEAHQYFIWLWDVLFPNEDYLLQDTSNWRVLRDPPPFEEALTTKKP